MYLRYVHFLWLWQLSESKWTPTYYMHLHNSVTNAVTFRIMQISSWPLDHCHNHCCIQMTWYLFIRNEIKPYNVLFWDKLEPLLNRIQMLLIVFRWICDWMLTIPTSSDYQRYNLNEYNKKIHFNIHIIFYSINRWYFSRTYTTEIYSIERKLSTPLLPTRNTVHHVHIQTNRVNRPIPEESCSLVFRSLFQRRLEWEIQAIVSNVAFASTETLQFWLRLQRVCGISRLKATCRYQNAT